SGGERIACGFGDTPGDERDRGERCRSEVRATRLSDRVAAEQQRGEDPAELDTNGERIRIVGRNKIDGVLPLARPPELPETQDKGERENPNPTGGHERMRADRAPIMETNSADEINERPKT